MFDLRTIDVWDTLLRRRCHPEAIKLAVARNISLQLSSQLQEKYQDFWSIYRERLSIECEIADASRAAGFDNEYVLCDVIERLLKRICRHQVARENVERICKVELETELGATYPDPDIRLFLLNYPSKRTLFLSDFYMPSSSLVALLSHHGMRDIVSDGVSSCDVLLNKKSGRLFAYIQQATGAAKTSHIHIGDNLHADVETPRGLGIQAVHYEPKAEHQKRVARCAHFDNRCALIDEICSSSAALAASPESQEFWFQLGTSVSPLVAGFLTWVVEETLRDGLSHLYVVSPQPHRFCDFWRALFPDNTLHGVALPSLTALRPSDIVQSSTLVALTDPCLFLRTFCSAHDKSASEVLRRYGFTGEIAGHICSTLRIQPNHRLVNLKELNLLRLSMAQEATRASSAMHPSVVPQKSQLSLGWAFPTNEAAMVHFSGHAAFRPCMQRCLPKGSIKEFSLWPKASPTLARDKADRTYLSEEEQLLQTVTPLDLLLSLLVEYCESKDISLCKMALGNITRGRIEHLFSDHAAVSSEFCEGLSHGLIQMSEPLRLNVVCSQQLKSQALRSAANLSSAVAPLSASQRKSLLAEGLHFITRLFSR
jgi:FMN phosphatase YigB (HAD superfamily)